MEIKPHTFELLNQKKHSVNIYQLIVFVLLYRMTPSISRMSLFDIWVRRPKKSKFDARMRYFVEEIGTLESLKLL